MTDNTTIQAAPRPQAKRKRVKLHRRNLPLLMLVARDRVAAWFRPIFKDHGLTEQQWRILRTLYEDGESSIGDVAKRCHVLGPSLTGILERMAQAGLLVKRIDESDTRRFYVSLTRAGRGRFEDMVPLIEARYCELEAQVGQDEMTTLYRQIDRLLAKLESGPFVEQFPDS